VIAKETIERVRADIPALHGQIYLNTGTMGPSPRPVHQAFIRAYEVWQASLPGDPDVYRKTHEGVESARSKLGAYLGVSPGNIALTGNSSDGVNIIISGMRWQEGDEIIISDQEHPAVFVPWMRLAHSAGARGLILWLDNDARVTMDRLRSLVSPRTRLVLLSHVTSMTGLVLPVREMADIVHEAGALFMLDGAQACGNIEVNIPSTGADFYTMNGHKWLLAPAGTGALFVSDRGLEQVEPTFVGSGSHVPVSYMRNPVLEYQPGAKRFEFGTRNWSLYKGLEASLDYLEACGGAPELAARSRHLATTAKEAFSPVPGVAVLSAREFRASSGIVTVRINSIPAQEVYARLHDMHIITRVVNELDAIRFSFAFFNTEEEVGLAADALAGIARGAHAG
jgi:L-cysteine/cystine lyase